MTILVECDCGRQYRVPDDKAGRKIRCKECGTALAIPQPGAKRRESRQAVQQAAKQRSFWKTWSMPITTAVVVGAISLTMALQSAKEKKQRTQDRAGTAGTDSPTPAAGTNPTPETSSTPVSKEQLRAVSDLKGRSVAIAPDGSFALVGTIVGKSGLWKIDTSPQDASDRHIPAKGIKSQIALSDDGARAAVVDAITTDIWDLASGAVVSTLKTGTADCAPFSPDGKLFVSYDPAGRSLKVWDVDRGEVVKELAPAGPYRKTIAFTDDSGRVVAVIGNQILIWNLADASLEKTIELGATGTCDLAGLPRRGPLAALVPTSRKQVWIYDLNSGRRTHEIPMQQRIEAVAVSGDGRFVFVPQAAEIVILATETGEQIGQLTAKRPVRFLAASMDGTRLVSIDDIQDVAVWAPELPTDGE